MLFANDTEDTLQSIAALVNTLVNTLVNDEDQLTTRADLDEFVRRQEYTGSRTHDDVELQAVRALRPDLRKLWTVSESEAVQIVNQLLADADAVPQLVKHDHWDWHLHATRPADPLQTRMEVEAAMAMVDVIRAKELNRLRICAAEDCHAVVVDLSRNRSKRYCDTGNCANRAHVAAYRARKAGKSA
ncbi:CGNR zinc finger domain-containing protein [Arthrobacter castelli]|uniref:CGNR zinc finger domain-containing protein n=1 Tax=Arthrobacter castelli TaxID=271431 RepID=UPI000404CDB0|nr:CGNR zinc finger domain-containing protein [Arthrobacter castelli]